MEYLGKWVPDFVLNEDHRFLDVGLAGGLRKHNVLVYPIGPGEQSVQPVESDGGDLLGLFENGIVLGQNAAPRGQIKLESDHSRQRQPQPQRQEVTSTPMPNPTTLYTAGGDFDVNKVTRGLYHYGHYAEQDHSFDEVGVNDFADRLAASWRSALPSSC